MKNLCQSQHHFIPDVCSFEDYSKALNTFNLGNNYHMSNNFELAQKYYLQALELFPLFGEAYLNLGNIYRGEKSLWAYKKAAEVIGPNSLCPNKPLYANAMSNIGHYLVELQGETKALDFQNIEQAISYYKGGVTLGPRAHSDMVQSRNSV